MTQSQEYRALARLAFQEIGDATGGIGSIHRAVADRVFRYVGPEGRPVRAIHHAVSNGVYAALRGGMTVAGTGAAALAGRRSGPAPSETALGSGALGALNGLIGDRLEREGSPLAERMALRVDGRAVPPEPAALAAAFPEATPRLVVFVHGLMETERAWKLGSRVTGETYGSRLMRDLDASPVYVRFNTGRHISENGRSLAELLDAAFSAWPVEVAEVALVGHSMGGLVARSACHRATGAELPWVQRVRHVVSLGSPHMGAPLAQGVHYASAALHRLPETRPFGNFLRRRSAGIRDLRQGSLVDEDWRDSDPDALKAVVCQEVPLLEGVTHCFVSATITHSPRHPLGRLIGDWLVLQPSASGRSRSRRIPFRDEDGLHVGGTHHLALLNHPVVYERLREWLET